MRLLSERSDYAGGLSAQAKSQAKRGRNRCGHGWQHRTVFPTIWSTFQPDPMEAQKIELSLGFLDMPYAIPNVSLENGKAKAHVRIGWLRSVCNIYHAFAINTMANMLAEAAGRDALEYLLELLGPRRILDLSKTNY